MHEMCPSGSMRGDWESTVVDSQSSTPLVWLYRSSSAADCASGVGFGGYGRNGLRVSGYMQILETQAVRGHTTSDVRRKDLEVIWRQTDANRSLSGWDVPHVTEDRRRDVRTGYEPRA